MDCNHARLLVTFARDRAALDQSEAESLEEHLNQCPDCAALASGEQRFDAALGQAIRDVPEPPGLKARLLARLPRRRLRRWVTSGLAAAAVVLFAIGVSWLWFAPLPEIAFDDIPVYVCKLLQEKVSEDDVKRWFEQHDLAMAFPRNLDVKKLDSFSVGYFQGRRVPKLEFLADGHIAHVYVLSPQQFKIDATVDVPSHLRMMGNQSMERIFEDGYFYLIVYTGGTLQPFRSRQ
jgi:hypothetical protein